MLSTAHKLNTNFKHRFDESHQKTAIIPPGSLLCQQKITDLCHEAISTDRPVARVSEEKIDDFRRYVYTPNGSQLELHQVYGDLPIYADGPSTPEPPPAVNTVLKKLFINTTVDGLVPPPKVPKKSQVATDEELGMAKKTARKGNAQAKTMANKNSDHKEFNAVELKYRYMRTPLFITTMDGLNLPQEVKQQIIDWLTTLKVEWLHLIDHASLGYRSQKPDNLVWGTHQANTQMLVIEALAHTWREKENEQLTLTVEADLIPNSHIAEKIKYTVTTSDGFEKTFTINPLSQKIPLMQAQPYVYIANTVERDEQADKKLRM